MAGFTPTEKARHEEIAEKVIESFLEPVLIWILLTQFGFNVIAWVCGVIWLIGNVVVLFSDRDTFVIFVFKKIFGL